MMIFYLKNSDRESFTLFQSELFFTDDRLLCYQPPQRQRMIASAMRMIHTLQLSNALHKQFMCALLSVIYGLSARTPKSCGYFIIC